MEKAFVFKNTKGDNLSGILTTSQDDTSQPIIILVHGFSSHKNKKALVALSAVLNKNNIATFRFDFYGHGESEGDFENITITEAVDDILQAIHFVKSLGYTKIGLVGSSFGGIASIMAASQSPELFVLGLKSPVSDYWEVIKGQYSEEELQQWEKIGHRNHHNKKLNYTFIEDFNNNDAYKKAPKITMPTILVHGDADETVPVSQSIKLAKLIPNCQFVVIKNADHKYSNDDHMQELVQAISEFIMKTNTL